MQGILSGTWCLLPVIAIAAGCCMASGSEVTVIGSATLQCPPPKKTADGPSGIMPASAEIFADSDAIVQDAPNRIVAPGESFFESPTGELPAAPTAGGPNGSAAKSAMEETGPRLGHWRHWLSFSERPFESNAYARFDYFQWNERQVGVELLEEHGTLFTLGYRRSRKAQLLRGEFFAGNMSYCGQTQGGLALDAVTKYTGARLEYEWHWNVNLPGRLVDEFVGGLGTRFWIRDLLDGIIQTTGMYSTGYQEIWWTLYPYFGFERKRVLPDGIELFLTGRAGLTAYTCEYISASGVPTLTPNPGFTGQVQCGFRYERLLTSVYFEATGWRASPVRNGASQPCSQMYTTGIQFGLVY